MNVDGDVLDPNHMPYGQFFRYCLDDIDEGPKNIGLEEMTKRRIIKSVKNLRIKMKLLEPQIYNNMRRFYLTIEI